VALIEKGESSVNSRQLPLGRVPSAEGFLGGNEMDLRKEISKGRREAYRYQAFCAFMVFFNMVFAIKYWQLYPLLSLLFVVLFAFMIQMFFNWRDMTRRWKELEDMLDAE
jgi:Flp pilus assembly protein TadB